MSECLSIESKGARYGGMEVVVYTLESCFVESKEIVGPYGAGFCNSNCEIRRNKNKSYYNKSETGCKCHNKCIYMDQFFNS